MTTRQNEYYKGYNVAGFIWSRDLFAVYTASQLAGRKLVAVHFHTQHRSDFA